MHRNREKVTEGLAYLAVEGPDDATVQVLVPDLEHAAHIEGVQHRQCQS